MLEVNKIYCGDCLELMKELPDKCVDAVITDPPYGIGISGNPFRQKFAKSDWDNSTPTKEYFNEIFRVSKTQVIWGGNYFNLPPTQGFLIWDKLQPENFSSSMCEMAWTNRQSPAKMFKKWVVSFEKFHPTTKPIELMTWCIATYSDYDDLILDPFLGSGTTAVAALRTGRRFIGIEISPEYCAIAQKRVDAEMAQYKLPFKD